MAAMNDPHRRARQAAPTKRATSRAPARRHRHVLVVLVNNQPGVLNRVASPRARRNFNIESLAVGHTERPDISRMTVTLRGDDFAVEQMAKQLYRLIDVLKVQDLPETRRRRARAGAHQGARHRIASAPRSCASSSSTRAASSTSAPRRVIVEHTGTEQEIDSLVALLGGFGIKEMVRTGTDRPGPRLRRHRRRGHPAQPAPCRPCPATTAPRLTPSSQRGEPLHARTDVLRQRRRPGGPGRPDRGRHRLRQPGPRPRPEPPRRAAWTSSSGLAPGSQEPAPSPRTPACASWTWPTP